MVCQHKQAHRSRDKQDERDYCRKLAATNTAPHAADGKEPSAAHDGNPKRKPKRRWGFQITGTTPYANVSNSPMYPSSAADRETFVSGSSILGSPHGAGSRDCS